MPHAKKFRQVPAWGAHARCMPPRVHAWEDKFALHNNLGGGERQGLSLVDKAHG
jgi:hypothetical protein